MNRYLMLGAALLLGGYFWAASAEAHSIYVFAYPDGSQICSNSYFGGKAKVRGGAISMIAATGEVLATAVTDDNGNACFAQPDEMQDLLFRVEASDGHQGEFTLPASELGVGVLEETASEQIVETPAPMPADTSTPCAKRLTSDDLNRAIAPVMMKLAEMESAQNSSVTLHDIIGGLGWLIGLAGAALWAGARKKKD